MDPVADWDPGMKRQCGRTRENTDRRTHVRARRPGASATWIPRSAPEPFVEISQMDGAYEPPHSSPERWEGVWGLEIDGGIWTGARVCFETLVASDGWGRQRRKEERASSAAARFSRCCGQVLDRGLMWLPLGIPHRESSMELAGQSALIGPAWEQPTRRAVFAPRGWEIGSARPAAWEI